MKPSLHPLLLGDDVAIHCADATAILYLHLVILINSSKGEETLLLVQYVLSCIWTVNKIYVIVTQYKVTVTGE